MARMGISSFCLSLTTIIESGDDLVHDYSKLLCNSFVVYLATVLKEMVCYTGRPFKILIVVLCATKPHDHFIDILD